MSPKKGTTVVYVNYIIRYTYMYKYDIIIMRDIVVLFSVYSR